TAPLLLIHGQEDANSGTFPIQSERLFQAILGNGGTARLVMLPHEGHGYLGRESVMHVLAEELGWLERWLGPASGQGPASGHDAADGQGPASGQDAAGGQDAASGQDAAGRQGPPT